MSTVKAWDNEDQKYVQLQWFIGSVIGKTTEPGKLWGTWYKIALQFEALNISWTRNVDFAEYCSTKVGQRRAWLFYSDDGSYWKMTDHDVGRYSELPEVPFG